MSVAKKLEKLNDVWASTTATSMSKIKDDDYVAKISDMSLEESKAGNLQVITTFEIADGNLEGETIKKFSLLESDQNIAFFKQYCDVIGLEYSADMKELPIQIAHFIENFKDLMRISVKTKGGYQNVYVNGIESVEHDLSGS